MQAMLDFLLHLNSSLEYSYIESTDTAEDFD